MNSARKAAHIAARIGVEISVEQAGGGTEVAIAYSRGGNSVYVLSPDYPHVALYSTSAWINGGEPDDIQTYSNYAHAVDAMTRPGRRAPSETPQATRTDTEHGTDMASETTEYVQKASAKDVLYDVMHALEDHRTGEGAQYEVAENPVGGRGLRVTLTDGHDTERQFMIEAREVSPADRNQQPEADGRTSPERMQARKELRRMHAEAIREMLANQTPAEEQKDRDSRTLAWAVRDEQRRQQPNG